MAKRPAPPNRLAELRMERAWTMQEVGEKIGKDATYIYKLETRKQRIPSDTLLKLADFFEVGIEEIMQPGSSARDPAATPSATRSRRVTSAPQTDDLLQSKIPVYGTVAGSHIGGASQVLEGPIDYIDAPRALENAQGLYGLYVMGDSMDPMFPHGSVCLVSKFKPPKPGRGVVVEEQRAEHEPVQSTIGILDQQTADKVILRKLNPNSRIEIPVKFIKRIHKVLDLSEILGVA